MSALLTTLQKEIAARLSGLPYFAGNGSTIPKIDVFCEQLQDIESQIEIAVGQIGVCCIVVTPSAENCLADPTRPWFQDINVVVRVVEIPTLNTTRPRAAEIAEAAAWFLHHFQPALGCSPLTVKAIRLADGGEGTVAYDVELLTRDGRTNEPIREEQT